MNFLINGGFLGAGKTSLMLQLVPHMRDRLGAGKIVILENEIGQVGIDDRVLAGAGYSVRGMTAGCVCCTLAGELILTVKALGKDLAPDWIIMEATGVAFPYNIKENIEGALGYSCKIVCLTDAQRWKRLFRAMDHLFRYQLMEADVVLVNKIDVADQESIDKCIADVTELNPTAVVVPTCANEAIPIELIDRIMSED